MHPITCYNSKHSGIINVDAIRLAVNDNQPIQPTGTTLFSVHTLDWRSVRQSYIFYIVVWLVESQ